MGIFKRHQSREGYERIFIAAWCCYIFTYPGRFGFGAAIAAIAAAEGYTTVQLGLIATLLFAAYGGGQLVGGALGDRVDPSKLVSVGFFGCAAANLMMALSPSLFFMGAAWVFNGLCCSLIWAPLVRTLTLCIPNEKLASGMLGMQYCTAVGTVFTFLLVAAVTALFPWRIVFYIVAALVGCAGAVWTLVLSKNRASMVQVQPRIRPDPAAVGGYDRKKVWLSSGFVFLLMLTLYMGFLKDGIQTWVPKSITDVFGTTPALSVFMSAVLPLVNTAGVFAVRLMQKWRRDDDLLYSALLFGGAGIILAALSAVLTVSPYLTVALFALASACVFGVSTALTYLLPLKFAAYGRSSTAAGLTNAFTYLGSALSGVGLGALAGAVSWNAVCLALCGMCLLGLVLAFIIRPAWRKFGI